MNFENGEGDPVNRLGNRGIATGVSLYVFLVNKKESVTLVSFDGCYTNSLVNARSLGYVTPVQPSILGYGAEIELSGSI